MLTTGPKINNSIRSFLSKWLMWGLGWRSRGMGSPGLTSGSWLYCLLLCFLEGSFGFCGLRLCQL